MAQRGDCSTGRYNKRQPGRTRNGEFGEAIVYLMRIF
jgi:hypothetical protein